MKKIKFLLPISIIPLLLTSCGNKEFVKTEFLNYHGYNVTEAEFDALILDANNGLNLAGIDYENTSYSDIVRSQVERSVVEEFANSKFETKQVTKREHSIKYSHNKSVLRELETEDSSQQCEGVKNTSKLEVEYVSQIYKRTVVEALKQKKIYRNVADFSTYPTFASFVRINKPVDPQFVINKKDNFMQFVLEDVPTKYYANENAYTSGIEYSDRQINTADYERTLSVSAVNQVVVKKSSVTINTQYEIKDIYTNFSDAFITTNQVNYQKLIVSTKLMQVETLTIGGKVSASSVDIDNYSLVNHF